jgi:frataxin
MVNSTFIAQAEEMLQLLLDDIEAADEAVVFDSEFLDGVLTLEAESGQQFVLNVHRVRQQIWLSSPHSGAHHFSWDGKQWLDRDSNELVSLLVAELTPYLGRAFR